MTVEDHLRNVIGDLVLNNAKLAAERDALHAKLKELEQHPQVSIPTGGHGHPRQE